MGERSLCGTLRSWGHLSFHCYLVITAPKLRFFGSKIFLWPSQIYEIQIQAKLRHLNHICNRICLFFCHICGEKLSGRTDTKAQNTSKLNDDIWNWPNLNARIQVFRVYIGVKLAETIQCNQKSTFYSNELSNLLSGKECKKK